MTNSELDANLWRFYAEARKKDGETYGKKMLLGFRHGIERYLNQPQFSRNLKMSTDPRFTRSNQMLDAQLVQLKKLGKKNSQHKPTLEDEDMEKLKSSDALLCPSQETSGFILFCTSADEAAKGNKSCRNPASSWMSMRAREIM